MLALLAAAAQGAEVYRSNNPDGIEIKEHKDASGKPLYALTQ